MKGNECGFLHQFDKSRMPTCRFFAKYNECKEPDCPFKHSLEDVKDCNMYKLGFCIHGPNCRYRHARSDGDPPDIAERRSSAGPDICTAPHPGTCGSSSRQCWRCASSSSSWLRRRREVGQEVG